MCRTGGRRCPSSGGNNTELDAARARLSRARRARALQAGDVDRAEAARQRVERAKVDVETAKAADCDDNRPDQQGT